MANLPTKRELNILKLREKYQGKIIEELFPNHNIIRNSMGSFMEILWQYTDIVCPLKLSQTKEVLFRNLKSVNKIGEITEKYLLSREIHTIDDLKFHLQFKDSAEEILNLIINKDYFTLCNKKNIYDIDVLYCFEVEDLLFLDIETLGLSLSPIIIVGFGYFKKGIFKIHTLFARELEEEIAICEHLRKQIFSQFKCFITYNGKSFDIPFLANRFLYFFEENPMINGNGEPYQKINTRFHHVDLYHNCRRKYKNEFDRFNLTNIEQHLLQWKRKSDIDGSMVSSYYRKYLKDSKNNAGLMKKCIQHNVSDIYSMPFILQKLIEPE